MNEKLKALNDITEKMLSGIDENSDHLLYKDDKYVKLKEQMDKMREAASERLYDLSSDDEDKKKNKAEIKALEEELKRAEKFCQFLDYITDTKKAMDDLNKEDATPEDKKKADKKAFDYMVKTKMAVADICSRSYFSSVADAIDSKKLEKIFDDDKAINKISQKDEALNRMAKIYSSLDDSNRTAARHALQNGTIQQKIKISYNAEAKEDDPKKYSAKVAGRTADVLDTIKETIESKNIQHVLKLYNDAQGYWLGSALSDEEEKASRRAFMECYEDELRGLYNSLNINSSANQTDFKKSALALLQENGLESMMRDYHDMMCDRKVEAGMVIEPDKDPWHYLYSGMSDEEKSFREKTTKSQVYDNPYMKIDPDKKKESSQVEGLKEFHKWIYRNCDKQGVGSTGVFFGANGSARGYMEDFIKAPYEQQIKTLYMIEHKTRRREQLPTDDEIKDYVPNLDKIKNEMVSTKWKVWQRFNGKKHRWNKIKECMDRLENAKKIPGATPNGITYGNVYDTASTVYRGANLVYEQTGGKATTLTKTAGGVNNILMAAKCAMGLWKSAKKLFSKDRAYKPDEIEKADNVGGLINTAAFGSNSVDFLIKAAEGQLTNPNYSTVFGTAGAALTPFSAAAGVVLNGYKSGILNVRNDIYGKSNEELIKKYEGEGLAENDPKKEILRKIKVHNNALIQHNKNKINTNIANSVAGVFNYGSFVLGGLQLAGAAGLLSGAGIAAVPGVLMFNNWYERKAYRSVIDAELYEDDAAKKKEIDGARANLDKKLNRLPETKKNQKIREKLKEIKNSDKRVLNVLRRNVARANKCVNEKQLKNSMMTKVGKDIYEMYKDAQKPETDAQTREINSILLKGAKNLTNLYGGEELSSSDLEVKVDPAEAKKAGMTESQYREEQQKLLDQKNIARIVRG